MTIAVNADQARLLRVEDAARLLNIGRSAVYDLIRSRRLRSVKIGASRRVPREAIDEVSAQLIEETTP
ncbi:helix-turn-helix domain-containing protein [Dactylosporangium sp. CA-052675]|uniref:helix-turn-helix domain-containing protein n=1 Tax=Dactylosporangium sp. CA-052675 TaxID=3239927 RepID=UPI003D8C1E37